MIHFFSTKSQPRSLIYTSRARSGHSFGHYQSCHSRNLNYWNRFPLHSRWLLTVCHCSDWVALHRLNSHFNLMLAHGWTTDSKMNFPLLLYVSYYYQKGSPWSPSWRSHCSHLQVWWFDWCDFAFSCPGPSAAWHKKFSALSGSLWADGTSIKRAGRPGRWTFCHARPCLWWRSWPWRCQGGLDRAMTSILLAHNQKGDVNLTDALL